jgi:DNA-binding MarR family transcriptional regulator
MSVRTDTVMPAVGDDVDLTALPITALVARLSHQLVQSIATAYSEHGFAIQAQDSALLNLLRSRSARLTDLATRLTTSKQALTFVVDRLERDGYLTREPDPADRRAKLIALTSRGRHAADLTAQTFQRIELQWRDLAGAQEWPHLRAHLASIAAG